MAAGGNVETSGERYIERIREISPTETFLTDEEFQDLARDFGFDSFKWKLLLTEVYQGVSTDVNPLNLHNVLVFLCVSNTHDQILEKLRNCDSTTFESALYQSILDIVSHNEQETNTARTDVPSSTVPDSTSTASENISVSNIQAIPGSGSSSSSTLASNSDNPVDFGELRFQDIHSNWLTKLCIHLNKHNPQDADWKVLAEKMEIDNQHIDDWAGRPQTHTNPARNALDTWKTRREATVQNLYTMLSDMNRDDCIQELLSLVERHQQINN